MKIAITGATGRIGRAITAEALRQGHSVVSVDRVAPAAPEERPNCRFVQADIVDYDALVAAFAGCRYCNENPRDRERRPEGDGRDRGAFNVNPPSDQARANEDRGAPGRP